MSAHLTRSTAASKARNAPPPKTQQRRPPGAGKVAQAAKSAFPPSRGPHEPLTKPPKVKVVQPKVEEKKEAPPPAPEQKAEEKSVSESELEKELQALRTEWEQQGELSKERESQIVERVKEIKALLFTVKSQKETEAHAQRMQEMRKAEEQRRFKKQQQLQQQIEELQKNLEEQVKAKHQTDEERRQAQLKLEQTEQEKAALQEQLSAMPAPVIVAPDPSVLNATQIAALLDKKMRQERRLKEKAEAEAELAKTKAYLLENCPPHIPQDVLSLLLEKLPPKTNPEAILVLLQKLPARLSSQTLASLFQRLPQNANPVPLLRNLAKFPLEVPQETFLRLLDQLPKIDPVILLGHVVQYNPRIPLELWEKDILDTLQESQPRNIPAPLPPSVRSAPKLERSPRGSRLLGILTPFTLNQRFGDTLESIQVSVRGQILPISKISPTAKKIEALDPKLLKDVISLQLPCCNIQDDQLLALIPKLPEDLETAVLLVCPELTDKGLQSLLRFSRLNYLALDVCNENEKDRNPELIGRIIAQNKEHLKRVELLQVPISDAICEALTQCTQLEWLNLHGSSVTPLQLRNLCKHLHHLKTLEITGCNVPHETVAFLRDYYSLLIVDDPESTDKALVQYVSDREKKGEFSLSIHEEISAAAATTSTDSEPSTPSIASIEPHRNSNSESSPEEKVKNQNARDPQKSIFFGEREVRSEENAAQSSATEPKPKTPPPSRSTAPTSETSQSDQPAASAKTTPQPPATKTPVTAQPPPPKTTPPPRSTAPTSETSQPEQSAAPAKTTPQPSATKTPATAQPPPPKTTPPPRSTAPTSETSQPEQPAASAKTTPQPSATKTPATAQPPPPKTTPPSATPAAVSETRPKPKAPPIPSRPSLLESEVLQPSPVAQRYARVGELLFGSGGLPSSRATVEKKDDPDSSPETPRQRALSDSFAVSRRSDSESPSTNAPLPDGPIPDDPFGSEGSSIEVRSTDSPLHRVLELFEEPPPSVKLGKASLPEGERGKISASSRDSALIQGAAAAQKAVEATPVRQVPPFDEIVSPRAILPGKPREEAVSTLANALEEGDPFAALGKSPAVDTEHSNVKRGYLRELSEDDEKTAATAFPEVATPKKTSFKWSALSWPEIVREEALAYRGTLTDYVFLQKFLGKSSSISRKEAQNHFQRIGSKIHSYYVEKLKKYGIEVEKEVDFHRLEELLQAAHNVWETASAMPHPEEFSSPPKILALFLQSYSNKDAALPTKPVEGLSFRNRGLTRIPQFFSEMAWYHLKEIDFSENQLAFLPSMLMPRIEKADFSHNRISYAPADLLDSWDTLKELNLRDNLLEEFPFASTRREYNLVLRIDENPFLQKAPAKTLILAEKYRTRGIRLIDLTFLRDNLSWEGIVQEEASAYQNNLTYYVFFQEFLEAKEPIPKEDALTFIVLNQAMHYDLQQFYLRKLKEYGIEFEKGLEPRHLDHLEELTQAAHNLWVSARVMFHPPEGNKEIFSPSEKLIQFLRNYSPALVKNTETLALKGLKLTRLPQWLLEIPWHHLTLLDCSHNWIDTLPFPFAPKIEHMNFSHNRISSAPEELIDSLEGLHELNLGNNQFNTFPFILTKPNYTLKLILKKNPLRSGIFTKSLTKECKARGIDLTMSSGLKW